STEGQHNPCGTRYTALERKCSMEARLSLHGYTAYWRETLPRGLVAGDLRCGCGTMAVAECVIDNIINSEKMSLSAVVTHQCIRVLARISGPPYCHGIIGIITQPAYLSRTRGCVPQANVSVSTE